MHTQNMPVKIQRVADTSRFAKRIGSVTYEVGVHFKKGATETMDKKIMRLIKNEMAHAPAAMPTVETHRMEAVQ